MQNSSKKQNGYLLIEILVSLSIFSIIVVSTTGALLSIMTANAKAQSLRSVMDNLNTSVENMSRSIRIGTDYKCANGPSDVGANTNTVCQGGTKAFSFLPQDAKTLNDRVYYYYQQETDTAGATYGAIYRQRINGPAETQVMAITSPEVNVSDLEFYLLGANTNDGQPRVVISISGKSGIASAIASSFVIQTTIVQRLPDCDNAGTNSNGLPLCPK